MSEPPSEINGEARPEEHGKKVSWEGDDDVAQGGQVQPKKKFTVSDVIGRSTPSEQEIETRILSAVETIDLNEGEPEADPETTKVLADIAAEEIERAKQQRKLFENEEEVKDSLLSHPEKAVKKHKRVETVEQRLFGLTSALAGREGGSPVNSIGELASSTDDPLATKSSDRLAATAQLLVGHANAKAERKIDIESQAGALSTGDGKAELTRPESFDSSRSDDSESGQHSAATRHRRGKRTSAIQGSLQGSLTDKWEIFREYLTPEKSSAKRYAKKVLLFAMLPSLGLAFLLYYVFGNPIVEDGTPVDETHASVSWCVRMCGYLPFGGQSTVQTFKRVCWLIFAFLLVFFQVVHFCRS
jgi:hypothetical protein